MDWFEVSPLLTPQNSRVTSEKTSRYNCVAWAAGDADRWWWPSPDYFWPEGLPLAATVKNFGAAFGLLGYEESDNADAEDGVEKVAIYVSEDGRVTHVARQLPSGAWTSKLGRLEDIEHENPDLVGGPLPGYGTVARVLRRPF